MYRCLGCSRTISLDDALCPGCGRFVVADLAPEDLVRRQTSRSPVLRIAVTVFGVVFALGIVLAARESSRSTRPSRSTERNDLLALHPVAEKYRVDHPGECPTVKRLVDEREVSQYSRVRDARGAYYVIECAEDETYVRALGPDGLRGTADDLTIPALPVATTRSSPSP